MEPMKTTLQPLATTTKLMEQMEQVEQMEQEHLIPAASI
jgi:hypothetical protein